MPEVLASWSLEPSIWLGMALLVAAYFAAGRVWRVPFKNAAPVSRAQRAWFLTGAFIMWFALVSPIDAISDRYLFSMHMVQHILLTHAHLDHVTGVARAKQALGAPVWLHEADNFLYEKVVQQGMMFGLRVEPQPPVDVFYAPGQVIRFGEYEARPHHTPGHCPGGVCLEMGKAGSGGKDLFVGDTLFAGGCGRLTVRVTPRATVQPCVYWPGPGVPLTTLVPMKQIVGSSVTPTGEAGFSA